MAAPDSTFADATPDSDTADASGAQINTNTTSNQSSSSIGTGNNTTTTSSLPIHNSGLPVAVATPIGVIHHSSNLGSPHSTSVTSTSVSSAHNDSNNSNNSYNSNCNYRQSSGLTELSGGDRTTRASQDLGQDHGVPVVTGRAILSGGSDDIHGRDSGNGRGSGGGNGQKKKKQDDEGWKGWLSSHKAIVFATGVFLLLAIIVGIVVPNTLNSSKSINNDPSSSESLMPSNNNNNNAGGPPPGMEFQGGEIDPDAIEQGTMQGKRPPPGIIEGPPPPIPILELSTTSPLCNPSLFSSCIWKPVGPDLNGPTEGDFFASNLSLGKSPHGSRVTISAPFFHSKAGYIIIYDIVEQDDDGNEIPLEYRQLGRDVIPKYVNDQLIGTMSDDGYHVVFSSIYANANKGHVKEFILTDNGYRMPLSNSFDGNDSLDEFGRVAVNRDGSIIAISDVLLDVMNEDFSETLEDAGVIRIYTCPHYDGEMCPYWKVLGKSFIVGETPRERFGRKMSFSGDGRRIAIGSGDYDGGSVNDDDYGVVRVYYLDEEEDEWMVLGQEIIGDNEGDKLGKEVKLSADGNIVAVALNAAWVDDSSGEEGNGLVRVYEYNSEENLWKQIGDDIVSGTESHVDFGIQMDLSDDGRRLAIGQARYTPEDSLYQAGRVQIFDYVDGSWAQVGEDIVGERSCDVVGTGFDISPDGSRIIVGFPNAEGMGAEGPECAKDGVAEPVFGFARLYQLEMS